MKKLLLILVALLMLCGTACALEEADVVGEWVLGADASNRLLLNADGTGVVFSADESEAIYWSVTEGQDSIVITSPEYGEINMIPITVIDDILVLYESMVLRKVTSEHMVEFVGEWVNEGEFSFDMAVDAYGIVRLMYDDVTLLGTWEPLSETKMRVTLADLPVTIDFHYIAAYDILTTGVDTLERD